MTRLTQVSHQDSRSAAVAGSARDGDSAASVAFIPAEAADTADRRRTDPAPRRRELIGVEAVLSCAPAARDRCIRKIPRAARTGHDKPPVGEVSVQT